jgi:RHS repeat-associated protein
MAKVNPFRWSTKYQDDESDFVYYGYRFYNPSTGRWLNRDPLGELGGKNLYAFCINSPIDTIDPDGLDWLQDAANYSAGIADSLTFGLTGKAREGLIWMLFDEEGGGINTGSGAYTAGEVTEVTVEVAVTLGGASLRQTAKLAVRSELEGGARAAFRRANSLTGGFVHHANPILGHPGGAIARYPLPFKWAARGAWNMKWVPTRAAHMAEHANMLRLEALDEAREATMFVRQAGNALANYIDGLASCNNWSVDISANVSGSSVQDGPIPEVPSSMIEADVQISESGVEGDSGGGE